MRDKMEKALAERSRWPVLKLVGEDNGKFYIYTSASNGYGSRTDQVVTVEQVRDYSYIEEEVYMPLSEMAKKLGLTLSTAELDTIVLHGLYTKTDFDAYDFRGVGFGLNIDGLSRVSGGLYKIIQSSIKSGVKK